MVLIYVGPLRLPFAARPAPAGCPGPPSQTTCSCLAARPTCTAVAHLPTSPQVSPRLGLDILIWAPEPGWPSSLCFECADLASVCSPTRPQLLATCSTRARSSLHQGVTAPPRSVTPLSWPRTSPISFPQPPRIRSTRSWPSTPAHPRPGHRVRHCHRNHMLAARDMAQPRMSRTDPFSCRFVPVQLVPEQVTTCGPSTSAWARSSGTSRSRRRGGRSWPRRARKGAARGHISSRSRWSGADRRLVVGLVHPFGTVSVMDRADWVSCFGGRASVSHGSELHWFYGNAYPSGLEQTALMNAMTDVRHKKRALSHPNWMLKASFYLRARSTSSTLPPRATQTAASSRAGRRTPRRRRRRCSS